MRSRSAAGSALRYKGAEKRAVLTSDESAPSLWRYAVLPLVEHLIERGPAIGCAVSLVTVPAPIVPLQNLRSKVALEPDSRNKTDIYRGSAGAERSEERRVGKECRSLWSP